MNRSLCLKGALALLVLTACNPFHRKEKDAAVQITSRFPSVHGAPVHLGHPHAIGIKDIARPDYGDAVPVADDDTVDTLSARILIEEHRIYPEAIRLVLAGGWSIEGRRFVRTHD